MSAVEGIAVIILLISQRFELPVSAQSGRLLTKENPATRAGLVRTSAFDPKQLFSAQAHRRAVFARPVERMVRTSEIVFKHTAIAIHDVK